MVKSWIYGSVSSSMLSVIFVKSTTYDIWKILQINFISTSKTHMMEFELHLQTTKKNDVSVLDYDDKMKSFAYECIAIKRLIDYQDLVILILEAQDQGLIL